LRFQEGFDDPWIEHRSTGGDLVDRLHQAVRVPEPFLEQVGDTGRALLEQLQRVLGIGVLRQHHDADVGMPVAHVMGELDPLGGVGRRHPDVEQHHVGYRVLQQL